MSNWDNSKTAEYTRIADRMLERFNPNHKDNTPVEQVLSTQFEWTDGEDGITETHSTDYMFDNYQYKLWIEQQQQENDYE